MCTQLPGRGGNCIPEDAEMRNSGIKPGSQIRPHGIRLCSVLRLKKKKIENLSNSPKTTKYHLLQWELQSQFSNFNSNTAYIVLVKVFVINFLSYYAIRNYALPGMVKELSILKYFHQEGYQETFLTVPPLPPPLTSSIGKLIGEHLLIQNLCRRISMSGLGQGEKVLFLFSCCVLN